MPKIDNIDIENVAETFIHQNFDLFLGELNMSDLKCQKDSKPENVRIFLNRKMSESENVTIFKNWKMSKSDLVRMIQNRKMPELGSFKI